MWRQRSRQHTDEMAAAVIRARQRREEEEKEHERSRKAAHEKLKALEEKALSKEKDRNDKDSIDFDQCSRHSSESREDRLSNRDSRFSNSFPANKAYPKNSTLPPRFQKQAELMRQQTGGQPIQTQPFEQRFNRSSESDSRETRIVSNSQPIKTSQMPDDSPRSSSQISSGHENFENERERRTPDERRQRQSSQSGSESNNWRAVQTQRPLTESKDFSNHLSIDDKNIDKRGDKKLDDSIRPSTESKLTKANVEASDNEKRNLIDRQESSQSSYSDKRSTSSREERHSRKLEHIPHLDWAAESESLMIGHSQKREQPRHRHVPITQKEFESFPEPAKKDFTPLKKINLNNIITNSDETKEMSGDKMVKDIVRKSETPPSSNETVASTKTKPIDMNRDENRSEHSGKDIDRRGGGDRDDSLKKDFTKDGRKGHMRYDSYGSRGRYAGQSYRGRGREYRRTRQTSESKSYSEVKESSSPGGVRTKSTKTRRKSISDESSVSEEVKKDGSKTEEIRDVKESKAEDEKDRHLTSDPIITSSATASLISSQRSDIPRRGRGAAFKTSTRGMPRVSCGPSNYGPPPSKTPFGDGIIVKSESIKNFDQNRNEKSSDSKNSNSKNSKDKTTPPPFSNQTSSQFQDNSISSSRKPNAFSARGSSSIANYGNHRSEPQIPPRFQNRQKRGSQSRNDRPRPHNERSGSSNQIDSDVTNTEEWETASESSDIADRDDRKSKKGGSTSQRSDSRSHKRRSDNKRSESSRGNHQSGSQSGNQSYYRNNGGRTRNQGNGPNSRPSSTSQRNGPLSANHTENITVCAMSDVTLDNPNAVEDALNDIKIRNRGCDLVDDQLNNSEAEDGFQTVSYKKRNRLNQGNDSKRIKQEVRIDSLIGSQST